MKNTYNVLVEEIGG